jgi:hypothetical protein
LITVTPTLKRRKFFGKAGSLDKTLSATPLGIEQAGFHAFRHFNVSLMDALHVPLKTIQERIGHALTGNFTLDVYGGKPDFARNIEAGRRAGARFRRQSRL